MGVNIGGCAYLGMAQALGNTHTVHAAEEQQTCHGVPESMGIDMGQAVTIREAGKPGGDAARVHRGAIVLAEHKALILEVCTKPQPLLILPQLVQFQQLHGFSGQRDKALAAFRFWAAFIYPLVWRVL